LSLVRRALFLGVISAVVPSTALVAGGGEALPHDLRPGPVETFFGVEGRFTPREKRLIMMAHKAAKAAVPDELFHLVRTPHYIILYNTGDASAEEAGKFLEETYSQFERSFPKLMAADGPPPALRGTDPYLVAFVFRARDQYQAFCRNTVKVPLAAKMGGFASANGYFATWTNPKVRHTIWHEGTHLLMFRRLAVLHVPNWLAEGMAEFVVNHQFPTEWLATARAGIVRGDYVPLGELLAKPRLGKREEYLQAESVFHWLYDRHRAKLEAYLTELRHRPAANGKDAVAKFYETFGMNADEMEREWKSYILKKAGDQLEAGDRRRGAGLNVRPWRSRS
jgi:hypothetical protein